MRTITEQTGWARDYPKMICQDFEVLASVSEYNFDLNNPEFVEYFKCRTGNTINEQMRFLATSDEAEHWLLNSLDFKYMISQEPVEFGEIREKHVFFNRILKGKLQDCWELFVTVEDSTWEQKYVNLYEN